MPLKRKFGGDSGGSADRSSSARAARGSTTQRTKPRRGLRSQSDARGRSCGEPARTAFPPLRNLAPGRKQLARGSGEPLSAGERKAAMEDVCKDVHAASTVKPQESKLRTIRRFLACFGLPLVPFTTEVVYALGAALKWRKYRTAHLYLYMARATAEREGAEISRATQRAMTDVIRSCKRGLGPAKRCEGLVLEILPTLPGSSKAWSSGGPWRPRAALILGSWWMLREIEFAGAELRSVTFNTVQKSASWTLPASKADPTALGETVTHGCCCSREAHHQGVNPLCPYHLLLQHVTAYFRRFPQRFDRQGWAKMGYPLFPDQHGDVCTKYGVTITIRRAAQLLGQQLVDPGGLYLHSGHALRVTGAQALSRAGLSEHTISLLARWGSAAVRNYIRKAPLSASHHLASVAFKGWQRNAETGAAAPMALSSCRPAAVSRRSVPSKRKKAGRAALAKASSSRSRQASRARLSAASSRGGDPQ